MRVGDPPGLGRFYVTSVPSYFRDWSAGFTLIAGALGGVPGAPLTPAEERPPAGAPGLPGSRTHRSEGPDSDA